MARKGTPKNAVAGPDAVAVKRSRCPPSFWKKFNTWWHGQEASTGQRPTKDEALRWKKENLHASNWGGMPAPDDVRLAKHNDGLKPKTDATRDYYCQYRMKQKIAKEAQRAQEEQERAQQEQRAQEAERAQQAQEAKSMPDPFAAQSSGLMSSFPGAMLQAAGWGLGALPSAQQQQSLLQSQGSYPLAPSTPPMEETGPVRPEQQVQQMHSHCSASVCQPLLQRMAAQHQQQQHQQHTYPQPQQPQVPMQSQQFLEDVLAAPSYRCAAAPCYTAHGVGSGVAPGWAAAPMASQPGHGSHGGWSHVSSVGGARQPHLPQWHHHHLPPSAYSACGLPTGSMSRTYPHQQLPHTHHQQKQQLPHSHLQQQQQQHTYQQQQDQEDQWHEFLEVFLPAPPPRRPYWSGSGAARSSPFVQPPAGPQQALPQRPWLQQAAPAAAAGPELEVDDLDGVLSGLLEDDEMEWLGDSSSGSVEGGERKRRVVSTGWLAEEEQEGPLAARQPLVKRRRVNRG